MACQTEHYVGRDVVLEYVIGCGDVRPEASEYKLIGSLRTKDMALSWDNTDTTTSDSIGALRENLATFLNLTISGDGLATRGGVANLKELTRHFVRPDATNGQPVIWLRMTFPDLTFEAFMLMTNLSRGAPYDDAATFSFEAMATGSYFGLIVDDTPEPAPAPTSVVVAPTTGAINTEDGTVQLTATVLPAEASQAVIWSSNSASATVDANGLVTAVSNGTAVIRATSTANPSLSATSTITITNNP